MKEVSVPAAKMEAMKESAANLLDAVWKLRAMATLVYHDRGQQQGDLTLDASAAEGVSLILDQVADDIRDNSDNITDSIRELMLPEPTTAPGPKLHRQGVQE